MIENLEEKLSGKFPVCKQDLIFLIDSWGRSERNGKVVKEIGKQYDLSNLNISEIKDFSYVFRKSLFHGNISTWDVSNIKKMDMMFTDSKFNGDISNWDISNVQNMFAMFAFGKFDGDISKWNFNRNSYSNFDVNKIFYKNDNFINKYNYPESICGDPNEFILWFNENIEKIERINLSNESLISLDEYLDSFDNIESIDM